MKEGIVYYDKNTNTYRSINPSTGGIRIETREAYLLRNRYSVLATQNVKQIPSIEDEWETLYYKQRFKMDLFRTICLAVVLGLAIWSWK